MKTITIKVCLLVLFICNSNGQMTSFDSLTNKMFLDIFINKPDSSVSDFVKKYFPSLSETKERTNWTIFPPDSSLPIPYQSEYNFIFQRHPFLNIDFTEGKLELASTEAKDFLPRISKQLRLTFTFDNKQAADSAAKVIAMEFTKISLKVSASSFREMEIWQIKGRSASIPNLSVMLGLYKDFFDNKYKLVFQFSSFVSYG